MDYKKTLQKYLNVLAHEGGSDLHISAGSRPTIRVDGSLAQMMKEQILTSEDTSNFLNALIAPPQRQQFNLVQEFDFAHQEEGGDRYRCNAFIEQGNVGVVMRRIPKEIRTIEELNLPQILETFTHREQGFFLVVGPVGQGKSTTLASMIDVINTTRAVHIVTVEDPVEYLHKPKMSLIDQREVRIDTQNFESALRSSFRQDIDVLLVGEMRGPETMRAAVTAAETGHLVFSTLHTNNAAQTINRIIDTFPAEQQGQIRAQLADTLIGIFSQRLVPRVSGGMIPAYELLISNTAVQNLIRESRTFEINTVIETSLDDGMTSIERSLAELVARGEITQDNARAFAFNKRALENIL